MNNNHYLTKIQEIKKEISDIQEKVNDYSENTSWGKTYRIELSLANAKLQTAVEFLQMTKEDKESRIDDISKEQILRKYFYKRVKDGYVFDIPINPREQEILIKDVINETVSLTKEKEIENINSALKEAGENNG